MMMMQKVRDVVAGLNTAGLVTGYRGSPLGAVDMQMERALKPLTEHEITFQVGINEDLAATAHWGAQQAELRGEGKYDGVFGLWYGKGPGVDRSGDVMRHANMAGTSPAGGVLMAMGMTIRVSPQPFCTNLNSRWSMPICRLLALLGCKR